MADEGMHPRATWKAGGSTEGCVLPLWALQKRDTHLVMDGVSRGTSGFPEQGSFFQSHPGDCLSTTKLPSVLRKRFFFQRSLALTWLSHFQH